MKKQLLQILIIFLPMMAYPVFSQDIIGIWKCTSSTDVVEGKTITDYMKGLYLTVNTDGTYVSTSEEMNNGTYTFQGNLFTIKNNKGATFIATVSVDGNQMSMQGTSSYGAEFSYIFEKYGDKTGVRTILSENKTDELYSLRE